LERIGKNERAVSPVIATILMVAITVVLAGVLVAYLNNISPPNKPGQTIGVRVDKTAGGDWLVSVDLGELSASSTTVQVMTVDGKTTVNAALNNATQTDFTWNDNNANGKMDAGDTVFLKAVKGSPPAANPNMQAGYKFRLVSGGSLVVEKTLSE
jgi:flagellin-like protein